MITFKNILTIVIPTYNHPQMIKYILDNYTFIDKYELLLQIHDSSTDESTKKIVDSYKYENVEYYRYDSNTNVDLKTILALQKVNTKYAYLCGDGILINPNMLSKIYEQINKDYNLIELYDKSVPRHFEYYQNVLKGRSELLYKDVIKHFNDNFWHMPFYGGSIVLTKVFKEINIDSLINKPYNGFVYSYFIYNYFSNHCFKAVVLGDDFLFNNIYKTESGWVKNKQLFSVWIDNFDDCVNSLPAIYDRNKKKAIYNMGVYTTFFTAKQLLRFKATDNYNYRLYKKYKSKIFERSNSSKLGLFVVAIIPNWPFKIMRKLKLKFIKR